jgi:hypothetical protein
VLLTAGDSNTSYMVTSSTFEVLKRELTRASDVVSFCVTTRRGLRGSSPPLRRVVSDPTPSLGVSAAAVSSPSGSLHDLFDAVESPNVPAGESWILRLSLSCDTKHGSASSFDEFYAWAVFVEATLNRLSQDIQRRLLYVVFRSTCWVC